MKGRIKLASLLVCIFSVMIAYFVIPVFAVSGGYSIFINGGVTSGGNIANYEGVRFCANTSTRQIKWVSTYTASNVTANKTYIYDNTTGHSFSLLASQNIIGNNASFSTPLTLVAGNCYAVMVGADNNGTYARRYNTTPKYTIVTADGNVTGGCDYVINGALNCADAGASYNILYIGTGDALASDTTSPTFSNLGANVTNNTAVNIGTPILAYAQWNDETGLSMCMNSSTTNGNWANGTWATCGSGNWSNYTYISPSTQGVNISIRFYANDTSNNINVTGILFFYNITVPDTVSPTYSNTFNNITNNTVVSTTAYVNLGAQWNDNSALNTYTFFNGTNNMTAKSFSAGNWSNVTWNTTGLTKGTTYVLKLYANDTSGNQNATGIWQYIIDNTAPTFSNCFSSVTNDTAVSTGDSISFGCQWNDDVALDKYWNASSVSFGAWSNGTTAAFSGDNWTNYTINFPAAQGSNLTVTIYGNDTSNNQNMSQTFYWYNTSTLRTLTLFGANTSGAISNLEGIKVYVNTSYRALYQLTTNISCTANIAYIYDNTTGSPTAGYLLGSAAIVDNLATFNPAVALTNGNYYNIVVGNITNNTYIRAYNLTRDYPLEGFDMNATAGVDYILAETRWGTLDNITYNIKTITTTNAITPSPTAVSLFINDTENNASYGQYSMLNLTAQVNVSGLTAYMASNLTGWTTQTGTTTIYNMSNFSTVGVFYVTAYTNGNSSYDASTTTYYITIQSNYPSYSKSETNTTLAGNTTLFSLFWANQNITNTMSHYIFSFDNCTGTLVNASATAFTTDWSNVTRFTNTTGSCTIRWKVYASNSLDNWASSDTYSYVTTTGWPNPSLSYCKNVQINNSQNILNLYNYTMFVKITNTTNLNVSTIEFRSASCNGGGIRLGSYWNGTHEAVFLNDSVIAIAGASYRNISMYYSSGSGTDYSNITEAYLIGDDFESYSNYQDLAKRYTNVTDISEMSDPTKCKISIINDGGGKVLELNESTAQGNYACGIWWSPTRIQIMNTTWEWKVRFVGSGTCTGDCPISMFTGNSSRGDGTDNDRRLEFQYQPTFSGSNPWGFYSGLGLLVWGGGGTNMQNAWKYEKSTYNLTGAFGYYDNSLLMSVTDKSKIGLWNNTDMLLHIEVANQNSVGMSMRFDNLTLRMITSPEPTTQIIEYEYFVGSPIEDVTAPTYSCQPPSVTNNTAVNFNTPIDISCQWNDNVALDKYVNSTNFNGTAWYNGTLSNFTAGNWSNYTINFPSTTQANSNITIKIFAKDSSNNQNVTGTWFYYNTTNCVESWSCSAWSSCNAGTQTRTCTDSSGCGTTVSKPAETQGCSNGFGLTLSYNQTQNTNGQSVWNETFTSAGSHTFYVNLPKNATVISAKLNLSGYLSNNIVNNNYVDVGQNMVDSSWMIKNNLPNKIRNVNIEVGGGGGGVANTSIDAWIDNQFVGKVTFNLDRQDRFNITNSTEYTITNGNISFFLEGNRIAYGDSLGNWNTGNLIAFGQGFSAYIYVKLFYSTSPINPSLNIGNSQAWFYSGSFSQSQNQTSDFSSFINTYLKTCLPYTDGTCDVPFTLHSDSAGIMQVDLNTTISYDTIDYDNPVREGQTSDFWIQANASEDITDVNATLFRNGTEYLSDSIHHSGSHWTFNKNLVIPSLGFNSVDFYWSFSYTNTSGTFTQLSSTYTQGITSYNLSDCTDGNITLNFTGYDEETKALKGYDMDIDLKYSSKEFTHSFTGNNTYYICINPTDVSFMSNGVVRYWNDSSLPRYYYLDNVNLTNITRSIKLYLPNATGYERTALTIQNSYSQIINDALITIQRNYNGNPETVAEGKTTGTGVFTFDLNPNIIYNIIITSTQGSKSTTLQPVLSSYTILLPGSGVNLPSYWEAFNGWSDVCNFDNASLRLTCAWQDTSGHLISAEMKVYGVSSDILVCDNTTTMSNGTFTCTLPSSNNATYSWTLSSKHGSLSESWIQMDSGLIMIIQAFAWGMLGLFITFVITMTFGFFALQLGRPTFIVFSTLLSLIFCFFMGFIPMTQAVAASIIGLIFAGIIIMLKSGD